MLLGFGYLYKFVMFYFFFLFKKQKIIDYRKVSWPKFWIIIFSFLLKTESVGPIHQQINLVSSNGAFFRKQLIPINYFRKKAPLDKTKVICWCMGPTDSVLSKNEKIIFQNFGQLTFFKRFLKKLHHRCFTEIRLLNTSCM